MRCPFTDELHIDALNTGDPRVAEHLASCPACRDEWARQQRLQAMLAALPEIEAPAAVAERMQQTALPTAALTCDEALELLEAYREDALTAVQAFLVDEHLLWCPACAAELEAADRLGALLAALPEEPAPAAIAERIAVARQPWWQRLLPQAPAWGMGFAAAAMLLVALVSNLLRPLPASLSVATKPVHTTTRPNLVAQVPTVPTVISPQVPVAVPNNSHPEDVMNHPDAPAANHPIDDAYFHPVLIKHPVIRPAALVTMNTNRRMTRSEMDASRPETRGEAMMASTADFTASARDDMSRMAREDELASIEESLSNAPVIIASTAHRRPDAAAVTMPSPAVDDTMRVDVNRALNEDLKRRKAAPAPAPVIIRNDDRDKATGVLVTIK